MMKGGMEKKDFNVEISIEKLDEFLEYTKDTFTKKLIIALRGKLKKDNKVSFIEMMNFNRIKNLVEKEKKKRELREKQKIPEKTYVYVFKISLTSIWRIIEIKGNEPLSKLDYLIQKAFGHEPGHLYEFRFGEYRFGPECDEWEEMFDGLTNVRIDSIVNSIGLKINDKGVYIYDFGENIKHNIELIEIKEPKENQKYPKITGNEKMFRCMDCKSANALLWCHSCHIKLCDECSGNASKYCQEGHYPLLSIYLDKESQWD